MTLSLRLTLLSALALAGCVASNEEPFPLDDGEALAPAANGYICDSYDANGKKVDAAQHGRLIPLRRNKKTQYVFVDDASSSADLFTLHRANGDFYVVAVTHSDGPGEDLYVAQFVNDKKEFRLYDESNDLEARAQPLARERGVVFAHNQFSTDLSGPVESQKAFMMELASDPKGWRMTADCRAKS
jgi:hypothetical protein